MTLNKYIPGQAVQCRVTYTLTASGALATPDNLTVRVSDPAGAFVASYAKVGATIDDNLTVESTGVILLLVDTRTFAAGIYRIEWDATDGILTNGVDGTYREKFEILPTVSIPTE